MKSVAVYNENWNTLGGGEKYACTIAETLADKTSALVTLLSKTPDVTIDHFRRYFNLPLKNIRVQYADRRDIGQALGQCHTAVIVSNVRPTGNRAQRNVYVLQIPYSRFDFPKILTRTIRGEAREIVKDVFRISLLHDVARSDLVLVYSKFVRDTLLRNHGIEAEVLYPAIDDFGTKKRKEKVILSVGRFFKGLYNDKRFDVLIDAFKQLCRQHPHTSWQYRLVGSCRQDAPSRRYLDSLRKSAAGFPIEFSVNAPYGDLHRHYSDASLFWHVAGYGVDEQRDPERTEHFGMTTVEAMSACCVPVAVRKGGQKEIVSDGDSGYLWNTVDELLERSVHLMNNPALLRKMGKHARLRFHQFDHAHFSQRCLQLFHELETKDHGEKQTRPA